MASAEVFDVSRFIDERKLTRFNAALVIWSFFIVLFDGYDISAISFAAPELIRTWGISNRAALGPVFSASLFGILIGSPLFGYLGDRYGRKVAVIASCLLFGIFTLAACWAANLQGLLYLRFFAGIGIGGLLPNLIALNAEYAPRRFRATLIIVMFTGITFGGSVPGAISVWLVPHFGWQAIFAVGGVLPILMAAAAALWLPESLKHLVVKEERARALALLSAMNPGHSIAAGARLAVADEKVYKGFNPKYLFEGGLALITPLLWICFACNLMGFYFLISWLPTLLTGAKLPPSEAAIATALVQIGGTVGGLALARPIDAKGFLPVTILFALAVFAVGALGYVGLSSTGTLMLVVFLAGFCVLGLQFGLNAASAMIYPTSVRSNGSGWAFGVGRVGSVAGPIVGGVLIGMKMPLQDLFLWATVPFMVGTLACIALTRLYRSHFGGLALVATN
jgi:AAHS family 4-hydroxybenzoate transporter-like MFS transporter